MNEKLTPNEIRLPQNFPLTLRDMERIRDLRVLLKSTQKRLATLEEEPIANVDLILQERVILEGTWKEIQRLERKAFYLELGPK